MRVNDRGDSIYITLSPDDTRRWARCWPCSTLSGRRVQAYYDETGLYEYRIDYRYPTRDIDSHEFNALIADSLEQWGMSDEHRLWFVTIGQFKG